MGYLHGYSAEEARRLRAQARHLAPWVFSVHPLRNCTRILEVGSGVGGQTELLLQYYPNARITALEREASSHQACVEWVNAEPGLASRVTPTCADALQLSEQSQEQADPGLRGHDGAFICWVLEHSEAPLALLRAVRSCLVKGARLAVFEVFNQSFFLAKQMPPVVRSYFAAYNELQRRLGGDPDVGARLGQLLHEAGYEQISVSAVLIQLDDRQPDDRCQMFDYMGELLASASEALREAGIPEAETAGEVQEALRRMGSVRGSVFHYTIMHATAVA